MHIETAIPSDAYTKPVEWGSLSKRQGRAGRLVSATIFAVMVSAFGPYLTDWGLRIDHVAVYVLLPLALVLQLPLRREWIIRRNALVLCYGLSVLTIWTLVATYSYGEVNVPFLRRAAALENYVQPIVVIGLVGMLLGRVGLPGNVQLLQQSARLVVVLLALHSILVFSQLFLDLTSILAPFQPSAGERGTVAARAAGNGRFMGVFDQPMESGAMYSLGLLCAAYLARTKVLSPMGFSVAILALVTGGVLSVSKVFLLGGMPLFLFCLAGWRRMHLFVLRAWRWLVPVTFLVWALPRLEGHWHGYGYLMRFLDPSSSGDWLRLFSAGRLGDDTATVRQLVDGVTSSSPWLGYGFGGSSVYDSAYVEYYVQGGFPALCLYLAVLAWIGWTAWSSKSEEGRMLWFLWLFMVGAGIGAPMLTMNRVSIIIGVLLALLFRTSVQRPSGQVLNELHVHSRQLSGATSS